jgi:hypothetical protein
LSWGLLQAARPVIANKAAANAMVFIWRTLPVEPDERSASLKVQFGVSAVTAAARLRTRHRHPGFIGPGSPLRWDRDDTREA